MEVDIQNAVVVKVEELSPKLMEIQQQQQQENNKTTKGESPMKRSRPSTPVKKPAAKKKTLLEDVIIAKDNGEEKMNGNSEKKSKNNTTDKVPENNEVPIENLNNGNNKEELQEKAKKLPDNKKTEDIVEMDPLVLNTDDADPELIFEESDIDSANSSPAPSRCKTRRSQSRNIPTPKTPKIADPEPEPEKPLETPIASPALDHTYDSLDVNVSMNVEVGSSTRLNFLQDSAEGSYLEVYKNRSLRGLSARRSIRPSGGDYLKKAIRNNQERADLNSESFKRKNRSSLTPEERKRMKTDTGLLTMFTSPLASIKSRFNGDWASSTPKLTAYKDDNGATYSDSLVDIENGLDAKKGWCSLM